MIVSALLVATAISAPSLESRDLRRMLDTYPDWAVRAGKSSGALIDVIVEPDGKVRECTLIRFLGDERLAHEECAQVERVRFVPARGPDGNPILGKYRTYIVRFVQGSGQRAQVERTTQNPDLRLEAEELPRHARVLELDLDVLIDSAGAVRACDAGARSSSPEEAPYVDRACQEAIKITATPLAGQTGTPTDYVANLKVRFEAPGPA
jgi:hypothetical protein